MKRKQLSAMNRRDVLTAGAGLATLPLGEALAGPSCPPDLAGAPQVVCPAPTGPVQWEWDVPSLQDETDFYSNVMGWTIPNGADDYTDIATGGYTWNPSSAADLGSNMHGDTEGDELWTWDQQWKRHGVKPVGNGSTTKNWRDDLLAVFKNTLLTELDEHEGPGRPGSGYGYDHLYSQGLCTIYNDTRDSEILPVLAGIRTRLENVSQYQTLASGGSLSVANWEGRNVARWTISAAYATQATNDPAWVAIRDDLVRAYETSPDWEEGGVIANGGGLFFASRGQSNFVNGSGGTSAYDGGRRFHSAFQVGLIAEAMWRCYVQTGSSVLRDRLIKIARYVQHYAHEPSWVYPNVGGRFGHEGNGSRWHIAGGDGSATNAAKDCSYDISLVNAMVIGYKLTGEAGMLGFARTLFSRGNRYDPGGSRSLWAPLDEVHKYVDLQCDPSRKRFQFNKGQLQYCYLLFENGGNPTVVV